MQLSKQVEMKSIKQIESSSDFCLLLSLPIELLHYIFTFLDSDVQSVFLNLSRYYYSLACSWIISIRYSRDGDDNGLQYLSSLSNLRQLKSTRINLYLCKTIKTTLYSSLHRNLKGIWFHRYSL